MIYLKIISSKISQLKTDNFLFTKRLTVWQFHIFKQIRSEDFFPPFLDSRPRGKFPTEPHEWENENNKKFIRMSQYVASCLIRDCRYIFLKIELQIKKACFVETRNPWFSNNEKTDKKWNYCILSWEDLLQTFIYFVYEADNCYYCKYSSLI